MKYALQNLNGLFIQVMGNTRNDYSFTNNESEALTFTERGEADKKAKELMRFNVKVVTI
jgi:hypothetical protein